MSAADELAKTLGNVTLLRLENFLAFLQFSCILLVVQLSQASIIWGWNPHGVDPEVKKIEKPRNIFVLIKN